MKPTKRDVHTLRPNTAEGLMQLLFHGTALVATAALVALGRDGLWLAPAMFFHGIVIVALFAPNHECVHRTVFRQGWMNDVLAWVLGWLLFIPSIDFRYFHFAHHRHTQDPERDPELTVAKPTTVWAYVWVLSTIPHWLAVAKWFWGLAIGGARSSYLPSSKRGAAQRQAWQYLVLYALVFAFSVASSWWGCVLYWFGPLVLAQPVLRAYLLAEHTGCEHSRDMFRNTRTVLTNPIVRALMWNMPLHAEHHAAATVPFYALPALHAASIGKHRVLDAGYRQMHRKLVAQF